MAENEYTYAAMPDPLSVYVPLESLTKEVIDSVITVVTSYTRPNADQSERTLLIFLLAIDQKLNEIQTSDSNEKQFDRETIEHAEKVRQWLVNRKKEPLDWSELRKQYDKVANEDRTDQERYHRSKNAERYFELTMKTPLRNVMQSRQYMLRYRAEGFKPEELKLYWNAEQLEHLCPKRDESIVRTPSHDPSDADAFENLRKHPVWTRNYDKPFVYKNKGIEKAVFDIPQDAQIIVLNFANEQSPGGGYLRNARAQEEVMLYNSDGYRSLLDLKYGRMGGGYAIPEFGLAYVRDIRFVDADSEDYRTADMMVSACYCLCGQELYPNPRSREELKKKNLAKFRAFMSAAVANTRGNGENTYLLLGPIGTGAFGNDVQDIGEVFREVLDMPMMNSEKPIRYVFGNIWFVSIDKWKNDDFEEIFSRSQPHKVEENQKT